MQIMYTCISNTGRSREFGRGGGTVRGAAPGRVHEGRTPPAQLGPATRGYEGAL